MRKFQPHSHDYTRISTHFRIYDTSRGMLASARGIELFGIINILLPDCVLISANVFKAPNLFFKSIYKILRN